MQENQAALLYQLQLFDLSLNKKRARLHEIEALLKDDEAVASAKTRLATAEETLKPLQARAHDLELEIKGLTAKIGEVDRTLYSGSIQNPKELTELQEESESLKRRFTTLNESLLDVMMNVEGEESVIEATQAALETALAAQSGKNQDLIAERRSIKAEANGELAKRTELIAQIDPAALKSYEGLRQRMRGTPVAQLVNGGCTICGVEQTSQGVQRVLRGDKVIFCESCGRILAAL